MIAFIPSAARRETSGRFMADQATKKSTASSRAVRLGSQVERGIDGMHREYRLTRRAIIAKLNFPTRWSPGPTLPGGRKTFTLVQNGRAPIDFAGTLQNGRAIFAEVKSNGKKLASLSVCKGGLHERHQLEELAARHRMGAAVVLLWWNEDRFGILAGPEIDAAERSDEKNIPASRFHWMEPMRFDWLTEWAVRFNSNSLT